MKKIFYPKTKQLRTSDICVSGQSGIRERERKREREREREREGGRGRSELEHKTSSCVDNFDAEGIFKYEDIPLPPFPLPVSLSLQLCTHTHTDRGSLSLRFFTLPPSPLPLPSPVNVSNPDFTDDRLVQPDCKLTSPKLNSFACQHI